MGGRVRLLTSHSYKDSELLHLLAKAAEYSCAGPAPHKRVWVGLNSPSLDSSCAQPERCLLLLSKALYGLEAALSLTEGNRSDGHPWVTSTHSLNGLYTSKFLVFLSCQEQRHGQAQTWRWRARGACPRLEHLLFRSRSCSASSNARS